jgi:hypothetical protein
MLTIRIIYKVLNSQQQSKNHGKNLSYEKEESHLFAVSYAVQLIATAGA